jgi:hypothetical protein
MGPYHRKPQAYQSSRQAEGGCLYEELDQDVPSLGADSFAYAYFPGPLSN